MKVNRFVLFFYFSMPVIGLAQNPIIQTNYTADPAPMVYNGKVYLYTSHDEDNSTWFTMDDWRLYTSEDMVNWTDHGAVLDYTAFDWAKMNAWAPAAIERNGKFYMYVPITTRSGMNGIGVAVADSPYGPFRDPLGKPMISERMADIDPAVFIDDDGQAYLYWGNPVCYYVKLNEDMISYEGEIAQFPNTIESFGKRSKEDPRRPTTYEEGPWMYKRGNLYYLIFAAGPISEHIGYSTSNNPTGSWEYQGVVMPTQGAAFTNHPAVIDFKGKTYFFYHNGALPGGGGFTRSVCVEEMKFKKNGDIIQMDMTKGVEEALSTINPYMKNEAETMAWSEGVKSYTNDVVGVFITAKKNEAYTKVRNVDFRKEGAGRFTARVGTTHNGGVTMEVRLDALDGKLIGEIEVSMTGGDDRWALRSLDVKEVNGKHDLYFVFKGKASSDIMFFDYWMFSK
ncbi:glycoside hydrolase family 43 protein [Reichenbachiella sp. MSK19-1]|uniref:glycoside hydrolase family 43 protein n=1 Tax=Reichenbachiella sp. MSK19-1 TaxID=1897631 RepID=UPI000E6B777F|nr:glycoside hydrolase family 43 protein [Reichenbachiella sp. MSK19-1]RJE74524.1 carbohydrate-binding protein [Reichenbachiella sp. MSK19-1]